MSAFLLFFLFSLTACAATKNVGFFGCSSVGNLTNQVTVPDLYSSMNKCVTSGDFEEASKYLLLARSYGEFDAMRVQDVTAGNAPRNIERMYLNDMNLKEIIKIQKKIDKISSNAKEKQSIYNRLEEMGFPSYYPRYMLDYGTKPVEGSGLVVGFEAKEVWRNNLLKVFLNSKPKKVYPSSEIASRKEILSFYRLMRASGEIKGLAWSSGEKKVAVTAWAHAKPTVQIFNLGDVFPTILSDVNGQSPISYDSKGLYLAMETYKFEGENLISSVIIRDAKSNKVLYNLSLPDGYLSNFEANNGRYSLEVTSIAFNPMSTNLVASFYASSFNGNLRLREQFFCTFALKDGTISSVVEINPELRNLKYNSDDNTLWGTRSLLSLRSVWGIELKPDDWNAITRQVFKRTWNDAIEGLDLESRQPFMLIENIHSPFIRDVSISLKASLIGTASQYGHKLTTGLGENVGRTVINQDPVRVWDFKGSLIHELPTQSVWSLDFSPDGTLLVTCSSAKNSSFASLWDMKTGFLLQKVVFKGAVKNVSVPYCSFSREGSFLAVGESSNIKIYKLNKL